jgi:hypothetical protein
MSHPLVSHSPDLNRLEAEGYDLEIRDAHLLLKHVPYVTAERVVASGTMVSELTTNGTSTVAPGSHQVWFVGSPPCDDHGQELSEVINQRTTTNFGEDLVATCAFSQKPPSGKYSDYYEKMVTYERILSGYAKAIDPTATAHVHFPRQTDVEESVFRYLDAASSRAGISAITAKLKIGKVGIVGLGGTGAYILDLIAKTPIEEIHLYDDDVLYAHNAFRTPGAASIDELGPMPQKVTYLFQRYDPIRRNIFPHPVRVDAENINELRDMAFVFIAIDSGTAKQLIVSSLVSFGVPLVDTGMGLYRRDESLGGILRVTSSTPGHSAHLSQRISFADEAENEYDWNIQTADLNMMNAAMAVIKWKQLMGFYIDRKHEFNAMYTVGRNQIVSGDVSE